jgi:hypothetical protein
MQVQNGPFLSLFFGDDLKKADNLRRIISPWWMMYRRFYLLIGFFLISDLLIAKDVDSHLNTNVFSDLTIEAFHTPSGTVWFKEKKSDELILFDKDLFKVHRYLSMGYKKIYALLVEPAWVHHNTVKKFVRNNRHLFSKVLTFDPDLLALDPKKFFFIHPCTTRFITQEGIFKKSKMVSMILSGKNMCYEHQFREEVAQRFRGYIDLIKPGSLRVESLDDYYRDVRYSIQIENCIQENYFTEKLLDCFKTGTVLIYRGCPNLEKFFNKEGVIFFKTIEDLERILPSLSEEDYLKRMDAIQENYILAQNYPVTYIDGGQYRTDFYTKVLDILKAP